MTGVPFVKVCAADTVSSEIDTAFSSSGSREIDGSASLIVSSSMTTTSYKLPEESPPTVAPDVDRYLTESPCPRPVSASYPSSKLCPDNEIVSSATLTAPDVNVSPSWIVSSSTLRIE